MFHVGGASQNLRVVALQVAFQQADYVAWNLWSSINARPLLPFKYQHLGDMMSLGAAPSQCSCSHQFCSMMTA